MKKLWKKVKCFVKKMFGCKCTCSGKELCKNPYYNIPQEHVIDITEEHKEVKDNRGSVCVPKTEEFTPVNVEMEVVEKDGKLEVKAKKKRVYKKRVKKETKE